MKRRLYRRQWENSLWLRGAQDWALVSVGYYNTGWSRQAGQNQTMLPQTGTDLHVGRHVIGANDILWEAAAGVGGERPCFRIEVHLADTGEGGEAEGPSLESYQGAALPGAPGDME